MRATKSADNILRLRTVVSTLSESVLRSALACRTGCGLRAFVSASLTHYQVRIALLHSAQQNKVFTRTNIIGIILSYIAHQSVPECKTPLYCNIFINTVITSREML